MSQTIVTPLARPGLMIAAIAGLAGCVSVPPPADDLASRHVAVPERFAEDASAQTEAQIDILTKARPGSLLISGWLKAFGDPVLERLVVEAWANNPDLYAAAARFEEAAASLRIAASALYPQVSANGGGTYTNTDGSNDQETYRVGLGVSWEADLWGRIRADRAAAYKIAEASGLEYQQARHSLAAAVATAYYAVATARQQLEIDRQLLEAERFTSQTTSQRVGVGLGTSLDEDLADSSVRLAEAAVRDDLASLRVARRALELLLGRYPADELADAPADLPVIDSAPSGLGVPSGLLERRPDVRNAELLVDAAYYDVKSARAARLPSVVLSADVTQFFDPSEFVTTVAGDILAPIFQGGRLQAAEAAANARQRQALAAFASVALTAFSEVENALSNERSLVEQEASLSAASERLRRASETAVSRYEQGLMTILDLQQIRRTDFSTRSQLLGVRFARVQERLDLSLALGGPVLPESAVDGDGTADAREDLLDAAFPDPADAPISGELRVGVPNQATSPAPSPAASQVGTPAPIPGPAPEHTETENDR